MIKTLASNEEGVQVPPLVGELSSHAMWPKKTKEKQKQCHNKLNKDFRKMDHIFFKNLKKKD